MKRNGFTLIELMIVVAIIGILAAIIIPQVASLFENDKRRKMGLPMVAHCFGDVASAFPKDGRIVKVYRSGCVETQ